jgi:hypothetical protein
MSLSGTERCSRVAGGPTARAAPPHGQSRRRHCPGCGARPWRHARRPITRLPQRANSQVPQAMSHGHPGSYEIPGQSS